MSLTRVVACLGAIGCLSLNAFSQSTVETAAIDAAKRFAVSAGIQLGSAPPRVKVISFPGLEQKYCLVTISRHTFYVDYPSHVVVQYKNEAADKELRRSGSGGNDRFASPSAWWSHADGYMHRLFPSLQYERARQSIFSYSDKNPEQKGRVRCYYEDRPFGVSTNLNGNYLVFEFDRRTGVMVGASRRYGFTIPEPRLTISEETAKSVAIQALRSNAPNLGRTVISVTRGYLLPGKELRSERGPMLLRQKKLIYGYSVNFERASVLIDGAMGDVIGGILPKIP